jgi:outer membrane lipoprotein carrier protein
MPALLMIAALLQSAPVDSLLQGMQRKYAAAVAVSAEFTQTYRAPGVEQHEGGRVWLQKPGRMRWEYKGPVAKLFVADGRQAYLHLPEDRQVQVRKLTSADLLSTPLRFILGQGEIRSSYSASPDPSVKPVAPGGVVVRLTPRDGNSEFESILLEIAPADFSLVRIIVGEKGGGTSELRFANVVLNPRVEGKAFEFKIPRGVEVIRVDER